MNSKYNSPRNTSSKRSCYALQEAPEGCFTSSASNECNKFNDLEIITWFSSDKDAQIPPGCLIDVIIALSGGQFMMTVGLGSRLLDEFGSIGGVLAVDAPRLHQWFKREGSPKWFVDQLHSRLRATAKLIQYALAENIQERPIIETWQALLDYLKLVIGYNSIEQFRVLFLDKKNILIKDEVQQRGTVDHTPLYPREIAKRSLELGASAIIMVHNHPSGDPTPSRADIEVTKQVEAALASIRVVVHDHLIIGLNTHFSFRSRGLL